MNRGRFVLAGLRHYRRHHALVVAGVAVAAAVIVGSLIVGDSVRFSLRKTALLRIGDADVAMADPDRFFRTTLAHALAEELNCASAALIRARGLCAHADGAERRNDVQVLGVGPSFWALGRAPDFTDLIQDGAALNHQLADELGVTVGDEIVLTIETPSPLSRDAPLVGTTDATLTFRRTVAAIVEDDQFGRFSLRAQHLPARNVYLPIEWMQQQLGKPDRANALLLGRPAGQRVTADDAQSALATHWQLPDAGLQFAPLDDANTHELRSDRIFLSDPVVEAATSELPEASMILTYFVNTLRCGDRAVPYSLVCAVSPTTAALFPYLPADLKDHQIVINDWLADVDNLDAGAGNTLSLSYYVLGPGRTIREQSAEFRIRSVVPLTGPAADPTLMPSFPGLAESDNCRGWDPGVPIALDRIRSGDEDYWDNHRGTPKAFISLAAGQQMWANRFGTLTAVRVRATEDQAATIRHGLRARLTPASLGLSFRDVRTAASAAVTEAMSFSELFIAFSVFLIVAAFLLIGLLFILSVEQRSEQIGILTAVGLPPGTVRRMILSEGALLALIGSMIGAVGGLAYARLVLLALTTIWRSASAVTSLWFHAEPMTVVVATVATAIAAVATMFLALRCQSRKSARQWLQSRGVTSIGPRAAHRAISLIIALLAASGALVTIILAVNRAEAQAPLFFVAGALLLAAALLACRFMLGKMAGAASGLALTARQLAWRGLARRRGRSLATIALLAGGTFVVVAVGAFRQDATPHADQRHAGTGGFALFAESTMPVLYDLNTPHGRDAYGLTDDLLGRDVVVNLRMRPGDDASCLNLNRAQVPRLLGVNPRSLDARQAFTFTQTNHVAHAQHPWLMLDEPSVDDVIPAIGDESTVRWGLGMKLGDTLDYVDERGRPFRVRIVGIVADSILQGSLIISQARFEQRFPAVAGFHVLLIDAPADRADDVVAGLTYALADEGLSVVPAAQRLATFQTVANTYVAVFQLLGGLGIMLGTAGLGVVVARNVTERRGELAVFGAVGFSRRAVVCLIVSEHLWLVALGLLVGIAPAIVAAAPALASVGSGPPYGSLAVTFLLMAANGLLWTWIATCSALAGPLVCALRNE